MVRNVIYKKRCNLNTVFKMIINVCTLDLSKLIYISPVKDATEVSNTRLIQVYSVVIDF